MLKSYVPGAKLISLAELAKRPSKGDQKVDDDPDYTRLQTAAGSEDHATAISLLHTLLRKYPDDPFLQGWLAAQYNSVGFYERAEAVLKHLLELDSTDFHSWEELGDAYQNQGKNLLAREAFKQLVRCYERQPTPADDYILLQLTANLYEKAGDETRATELRRRAEKLRAEGKVRNPFELSPPKPTPVRPK